MTINDEHLQTGNGSKADRVYATDILPRLQSLLAILADLDVTYGSNLLVIESRPMDDTRKEQLIADLWQFHCRRRAPYLREIEALRAQMEVAFH